MSRKTHEKLTGKPCKNCGGTERYGRSYSCVTCTNARSAKSKQTLAYKKQAKKYWMVKRYGVTPEEFDRMFRDQGCVCACCGTDKPGHKHGWIIDHDHVTGEIRGVVCHGCNVGFRAFKDDPEWMMKAIQFLYSRRSEPSWHNHLGQQRAN